MYKYKYCHTYCHQLCLSPVVNIGAVIHVYIYMGQCPAKSGLWGYNFITIKIAHCTKQHIFATVLRFSFKFRTLVPTPFLYVKIDFCDLHIFRAVDTTIVNPRGLEFLISPRTCTSVENASNSGCT